jgi:biopolymer transport protein ExbB
MRLYEYIQQGGSIMYVLLFLNIIGFALMIMKFWLFTKENKDISSRVNNMSTRIKGNSEKKDIQAIIEITKQEVGSYINNIEKGLNTVKIIASISPLLGLLGTVLGVLGAFKVMATQGTGDPSLFASGISVALITTVGGMIVAIPHFIGHNYLIGQLDSIEAKVEKEIMSQVL